MEEEEETLVGAILTMEEVWQKYKYIGKVGQYEMFKYNTKKYFFEDIDEFYVLRGVGVVDRRIAGS